MRFVFSPMPTLLSGSQNLQGGNQNTTHQIIPMPNRQYERVIRVDLASIGILYTPVPINFASVEDNSGQQDFSESHIFKIKAAYKDGPKPPVSLIKYPTSIRQNDAKGRNSRHS